ncbi:MAG TPA: TaqI-like C-terminal specificity domain-containing protein, partial [Fimbriimonadaceae bacterium]|nr:TaqI-like C-terminal specificity domain-containing protein [Fimbriimonadaceae bacterium]
MKGFVPTPAETVDQMVELLFGDGTPSPSDVVLDPGCGRGAFVDGVIRWCNARGLPLPEIVCVESDPKHIALLRERYATISQVKIEQRDYLNPDSRQFRFIIGNPPYVPITGLSVEERGRFRSMYSTARGRFDLYLLFFEQALRNLAPGGRLVFITPEKFLYVETAGMLRKTLAQLNVAQILMVPEDTFPGFVTYPTITAVENNAPGTTRFTDRYGGSRTVVLPSGTGSWLPRLLGSAEPEAGITVADICLRVSCGVATGADRVYVRKASELSTELLAFARPTVSGRQIVDERLPESGEVMLIPYNARGELLSEERLGALGEYLRCLKPRLLERTCTRYKPWYAFHETPMLTDILRPKILCKDICESPRFVADLTGEIVPRHSVYYLVPRDPALIPTLLEYLNSEAAALWLRENSQRAAKGFLRMQSHVLQRLPIPSEIVSPGELQNLAAR